MTESLWNRLVLLIKTLKEDQARAAAVVGACVAVAHTLIAATHGGPVALPDVSAYLSVAQWVHGNVLPESLPFFPGYGLLLTPVGWLQGDQLHTAALIFNGALVGLMVPMARLLAQRCGISQRLTFAVVVLAAVHPSLSAASRIAWPETLLSVLVIAAALVVSGQSRHRLAWLGVLCGLGFVLHPRAAVLVGAALVVSVRRRTPLPTMLGVAFGLTTSLALIWATETWPSARIDAITRVSGGSGVLATTSGQVVALVGASAGLALVGMLSGLFALRSRANPRNEVLVFLAVSGLGMVVLAGWVLAGSDRIDTVLYSRYLDPWILPLSIVGLATLRHKCSAKKIVLSGTLVVVVSLSTLLLSRSQVDQVPRTIMTMSNSVYWYLSDNVLALTALFAALVGVAGCVLSYSRPSMAVIMCIGLGLASTVIGHQRLHHMGEIAEGQVTLAEYVPENTSCLSHDSSVKSYVLWLYRLELPALQHRRVDVTAGDGPCGSHLLASPEAVHSCGGAKYVASERRGDWGLWRYPATGCD